MQTRIYLVSIFQKKKNNTQKKYSLILSSFASRFHHRHYHPDKYDYVLKKYLIFYFKIDRKLKLIQITSFGGRSGVDEITNNILK